MDKSAPIQGLKQRLAEASTDAARLAVLRDIENRSAELPRDEVEAYAREAVALARKTRSYNDLVRAAIALSQTCPHAGGADAWMECAEIVHEAARASGNSVHEGQYLYLMGRTHEVQGNYELARDCYERSLRAFRNTEFADCVCAALNQLGNLALTRGQPAEALEYYHECLKIDDDLGDIANGTLHRYNIGQTLTKLGRWEDAEFCYGAIALSEQHQMPEFRAYALNALGELFLERDRLGEAVDALRKAQDAVGQGEVLSNTAREITANLGLAHHRHGDLASAGQAYDQALAMCEKSGDRRVMTTVLWRMAELALNQGQLDRCRDLAERSAAVAREVELRDAEAQALRVMALLHAARGEDAQARDSFEQAMALLRDVDDNLDLARVQLHYGRYLLKRGERDPAVTHLEEAARVFRDLDLVGEQREVNRMLFQQETGVDSDLVLLQGISGLASLGVEPRTLVERATGLLLETLRFDSAVIIARSRPVLVLGEPKLAPALGLSESQELVATDLVLSWPVRRSGSLLGRIHLERARPAVTELNHLVLDTIASLLAAPIQRLAEPEVRGGVGPGWSA